MTIEPVNIGASAVGVVVVLGGAVVVVLGGVVVGGVVVPGGAVVVDLGEVVVVPPSPVVLVVAPEVDVVPPEIGVVSSNTVVGVGTVAPVEEVVVAAVSRRVESVESERTTFWTNAQAGTDSRTIAAPTTAITSQVDAPASPSLVG